MSEFLSENFQEIAHQQALFNAFFAGAQTGMLILDNKLRYVHVNEALAETNGIPVAEHIGRTVREVLPEIAPVVEPMLQGILDTGISILDHELAGETPKQPGVIRYWLASYYPLFADDGAAFGVGAVVIEISDRKQAEQALQASQERLKLELEERKRIEEELKISQASFAGIVEIADDAIISINSHQKITLFNQGAEKIFGYTAAEVIGQPLGMLMPTRFDTVHHEHISRFHTPTNQARQMANRREIFGKRKNGVEFPAEASISQLEVQGEKIFTAILRDISDRRQIEVALRDNEARLRQFVEYTPTAIAMLDQDLRYITVSHQWLKEFNLSDIIGRSHYEVFPDIPENWKRLHQRCLAGAIEKADEDSFPRADGSVSWLRWGIYPWYKATGEIGGVIMYSENITKRKQTEIALQKSEERYRCLIKSTSQIVWTANTEGQATDLGEWGTYTGQTLAEMKGSGWAEAIHPDDQENTTQAWQQALATKTMLETEYRLRAANGSYRYFAVKGVPILDADGNVREWMGTCTDIHDRKQAEAALQQSEERYRSLIKATSQIVWTTDAQGRTNELGDWSNYTGQSLAEMVDYGWGDAIHPEDREYSTQAWIKALQTKTIYETEFRIRDREGSYRYFSTKGVPILDADGNIREWMGTCTDIHDRKQAEISLQLSEERFRSLITATSQIIWRTDAEGKVTEDLPEWRTFTGRSLKDTLGFSWLEAIHPEDKEKTGQIWGQAVQTKTVFDSEYRLRRADGSYRYFVSRGVPILNQDGSIREWMGSCTDIDERKQAEIAIAQAKDAAEAASRAKSEFLANMSHELRTPLNGILGYAQVLQRSRQINSEDKSRIDVIYQCGSHLLTLINDILDLSKIEAQKVELLPSDFHFPAFLQGVAEMCRVRAELKGIQFHYQFAPELPTGIRADEKRLRQVLINLLSNAIKFTDSGSVNFTISYASEEKIRFEVRDTGTGIAKEKVQAIFQPFEQVGDARRQTEGTGLGLAISQKIVELMGSTIQVQSEIGVGSIFWFDVSLPQATEWVKTSQIDRHGQIIGIKERSPKVIVIDDKWENRSVVNNLLTPIGFDVYEAIDGQAGWDKVLEIEPDLVITDLLMPKLNGFELLKRIRESEAFKDLVVIVSSASVFEADQYRSIDAGGNAFLPKPLQATELLQQLQKHLKLEWIYEERENSNQSELEDVELVAPGAEELDALYELVMKGNFKGIIKQAALLEEQNPKFIPFAKKLHQMAKEFQDEKIMELIESYK